MRECINFLDFDDEGGFICKLKEGHGGPHRFHGKDEHAVPFTVTWPVSEEEYMEEKFRGPIETIRMDPDPKEAGRVLEFDCDNYRIRVSVEKCTSCPDCDRLGAMLKKIMEWVVHHTFKSGYLTTNNDYKEALRLLAERGLFEITEDNGNTIVGRFAERKP